MTFLVRQSVLCLFLASGFVIGCGSGPAPPPTDEERQRIEQEMQQELDAMPTLPPP